jgi:hypothetical protein
LEFDEKHGKYATQNLDTLNESDVLRPLCDAIIETVKDCEPDLVKMMNAIPKDKTTSSDILKECATYVDILPSNHPLKTIEDKLTSNINNKLEQSMQRLAQPMQKSKQPMQRSKQSTQRLAPFKVRGGSLGVVGYRFVELLFKDTPIHLTGVVVAILAGTLCFTAKTLDAILLHGSSSLMTFTNCAQFAAIAEMGTIQLLKYPISTIRNVTARSGGKPRRRLNTKKRRRLRRKQRTRR